MLLRCPAPGITSSRLPRIRSCMMRASFTGVIRRGANVRLVNALTVVHPLATARDAENYVARLGQVSLRMKEASAEAHDDAAKKPVRLAMALSEFRILYWMAENGFHRCW